jgi:HK97 family phage portal protein
MSLSKRLRASGEARDMNSQYILPLIPPRPLFGVANTGTYVDTESAIRTSTVYSCVRLLGDTISSLPMGAYVRRGRNRLSYATVYGYTPEWVNKPNPETTRLEFIEQVITSLHLHGNAFILTVRDDNDEVTELYVLNPNEIRIERLAPGEPLIYRVKDTEKGIFDKILTSKELLHIPLFRMPGSYYGLSPIGACRMSVGIAQASDTYAASYFGNASNPGGVIEVAGELNAEQAGDIARNWQESHSGPYMSGKVGILSGGAAFKPLQLNAADAQLIEVRRFNVEDIARIFRVPLSLLGHPSQGAMSYASVEAQNLSFVQHSLRPLLERLEQALSPLLPEADGFIRFNLDALLRGTTIERFDAYTKGLREGFLSLNDVRNYEDLSSLGEAGDQYRLPLQNIDANQAPLVGDKLKAEIASILVQAGYNPDDVAKMLEISELSHTGLPSAQLQQVALIDPEDPNAVYSDEVKG